MSCFICRIKTQDGTVMTFTANNKIAIERIEDHCRATHCPGFTAEAESPDANRGKILSKWDYDIRWARPSYTITNGAYQDRTWAALHHEEDAKAAAKETNDKCQCWADVRAKVRHVAGDLWLVEYCDPYKD